VRDSGQEGLFRSIGVFGAHECAGEVGGALLHATPTGAHLFQLNAPLFRQSRFVQKGHDFGHEWRQGDRVATDATTVTILTSADSQNTGSHNVHTSIKWVTARHDEGTERDEDPAEWQSAARLLTR
jgi:hypothetical protein